MLRLASTLFASEGGTHIGLDHGALLVRAASGQRTRVPMRSLDAVILIGGSSITSEATARCVTEGIRVSVLTRSGRLRYVCHPPTSGNVHLRLAQVRAADDQGRSLEVARWIVAGKVHNSLRLVRRWVSDASEGLAVALPVAAAGIAASLGRIEAAPSADHLRGVEGVAARWHFTAMGHVLSRLGPAFRMPRRSRRPPGDPLNAALGFGYGIMTAELAGAADAVGLDPQIGFLHGVRSGRPALALDVLEELRSPIVDRFVVGALRRRQLRLEHFVETPGGGWYLTDDGRRRYLALFEEFRAAEVRHELLDRNVPRWALPVLQMTVMARYLRGDLPVYLPWQSR